MKRWCYFVSVGSPFLGGIIFSALFFFYPAPALHITDLLATILSMLAGVSMAVTALLGEARRPLSGAPASLQERVRIASDRHDANMRTAQIVYLRLVLFTILFCLIFKWAAFGKDQLTTLGIRLTAALVGGLGGFCVIWSLRLPMMLQTIALERRA